MSHAGWRGACGVAGRCATREPLVTCNAAVTCNAGGALTFQKVWKRPGLAVPVSHLSNDCR